MNWSSDTPYNIWCNRASTRNKYCRIRDYILGKSMKMFFNNKKGSYREIMYDRVCCLIVESLDVASTIGRSRQGKGLLPISLFFEWCLACF
jgi:hypothetical protein